MRIYCWSAVLSYCRGLCNNNAELCIARWKGYLAFLPDSLPGMPMSWSWEALASLAGTSLLDKLNGMKAVHGCYVEPPCQVPCSCCQKLVCMHSVHSSPLILKSTYIHLSVHALAMLHR